MNPIETLLRRQPFLISDGAFTTELERRGIPVTDELWGAYALVEHEETVKALYRAYCQSGVDIITTGSYQATIEGFRKKGLSPTESRALLKKIVVLAKKVITDYQNENKPARTILLAASIGPYGAYRADGSEYKGNYGKTLNELIEFHRERLHILVSGGADLLACETLPSFTEAEALITLLSEVPKIPAWFSFTCPDGTHIAEGDKIKDVVARLEQEKQIIAIGINCTNPVYIENLVKEIKTSTDKPIIVYPNSGETWDNIRKKWKGTPVDFTIYAEKWIKAGARIIGGCCRTTPEDMKKLVQWREKNYK